jgi:hypothetical protein
VIPKKVEYDNEEYPGDYKLPMKTKDSGDKEHYH